MESNGTDWLADNLHAVDHNVKQLRKLIEDSVNISGESEKDHREKPELVNHLDKLYDHYRLLAERYSQLAKEQGEHVTDSEGFSTPPYYTPASKLTALKPNLIESDVVFSALSYKDDAGSSSTSLSDSDSSVVNGAVIDVEKKVAQNGIQTDLLRKIKEYEHELIIVNAKLHLSEEEASSVKSKLVENEILVEELRDKLQLANVLAEKNDMEFCLEKKTALELENMIVAYVGEVSKYGEEIQMLQEKLIDIQRDSAQKEAQHESEISELLEQRKCVDRLVEEQAMQCEALETEINVLKNHIELVKSLHEDQEIAWKTEVESLKTENTARGEDVEALNKCADTLKLKYDTANARLETLAAESSHKDDVLKEQKEHIKQLFWERDELSVNIRDLRAQVSNLRQLEDCLSQSQVELLKAIEDSDNSHRTVDMLLRRATELEEELDQQRTLVLEGAELKREAIRQLCMSLEHYRSGYEELRDAVAGKRRRMTETSRVSSASSA